MILAVDTETTGPDFWHGCRPFIVSMCDGRTNSLFFTQVDPEDRTVDWEEVDIRAIQLKLDTAKQIIFHNATFDIKALESIGVKTDHLWDKIDDTLLASHLICSGDSHRLKDLGIKYLRFWNDDEKELEKQVQASRPRAKKAGVDVAYKGHPHWPGLTRDGISYWKFDYWLALDACMEYAALDVERTWALWHIFDKSLKRDLLTSPYYVRRQLIKIVYSMEKRGVYFYKAQAAKQIDAWETELEQIRMQIAQEWKINYVLDLDKPAHLVELLHGRGKIPVAGRTAKTGQPAMNKTTLAYYEQTYADIDTAKERIDADKDHILRVVALINTYKKWKKMSTRLRFLKGYYAWTVGDRVHTRLNITGTRETRQSQSDPNLMNVEPELKKFFGPPKGYVWLMLDMVNIELRIWAYDVGNEELISFFEKGGSVHVSVMETLYPKMFVEYKEAFAVFQKADWWWEEDIPSNDDRSLTRPAEYIRDHNPTMYSNFKTAYEDSKNFKWLDALKADRKYRDVKSGNFALIYGATEKKADQTYGYKGATQKVFKRFPGIKEYFEDCRKQVYANLQKWGVPCVFPRGGYRLDVPLQEPYKAANFLTQGAAGWFMTLAMVAVAKNRHYKEFDCQMIEQVHDSLTIEIPVNPKLDMIVDSIIEAVESSCLHLIKGTPVTYKIKECQYE